MELTTRAAIDIATEAGRMLKEMGYVPHDSSRKEALVHADIVTAHDIAIETYILNEIRTRFPTHAILSEETQSTTDPKTSPHVWIVDPIDGTISFASGLPLYSVSISYFENQKPRSSALYLASTNEVLWCETGGGAYVGDTNIHVRDLPPEEAVIALDHGVRTREITMKELAPNISLGIRALLMTPGEAGNIGLVARGNIQGLLCSHPQVWDFAAGMHIALEAGAVVTDYAGNAYDDWFARKGHIICTKSVLPYLLSHTKKVAHHYT
ncbi:inositol monophosphatase family protein [Patescibacteria group bacterium]|nr:inositol monophosphatase family protein [Patescibacteria group bacterium]